MVDEKTNEAATLGDAVGLVTKADLEMAQKETADAQRIILALRAEIEAQNATIKDRDKDLEAAREVITESQQTRSLAVKEACAAKANAGRMEKEVADREGRLSYADLLVKQLREEKKDLWDRLKKRDEAAACWFKSLEAVKNAEKSTAPVENEADGATP